MVLSAIVWIPFLLVPKGEFSVFIYLGVLFSSLRESIHLGKIGSRKLRRHFSSEIHCFLTRLKPLIVEGLMEGVPPSPGVSGWPTIPC